MTDGISVVVVNIKHALYSGILPEYTILCISCKCYTILILNTSLNLVRGSQQDWNGDLWIVLALETMSNLDLHSTESIMDNLTQYSTDWIPTIFTTHTPGHHVLSEKIVSICCQP